jgi:uncharacterized LabA/DUF88 family protein
MDASLPPSDLRPGEWPEQRVGLFVDTQNLYYAARDVYSRHVDYERLLALSTRGRRLAQASAYVVEREGEATAYGFVTKLSALGYRVRRRKVRVHRADSRRGVPCSRAIGIWASPLTSCGRGTTWR